MLQSRVLKIPIPVDLIAHEVLDDGAPRVGAARERRVVVLAQFVSVARQVHAPVDAEFSGVARPERDLQVLGDAPVTKKSQTLQKIRC